MADDEMGYRVVAVEWNKQKWNQEVSLQRVTITVATIEDIIKGKAYFI